MLKITPESYQIKKNKSHLQAFDMAQGLGDDGRLHRRAALEIAPDSVRFSRRPQEPVGDLVEFLLGDAPVASKRTVMVHTRADAEDFGGKLRLRIWRREKRMA